MPRVTRNLPISATTSKVISKLFMTFVDGMNTYAIDEEVKDTQLRLAQDARITNLGAYKTRQGTDFYSQAAGLTLNTQQVTVTGAADQSFTTLNQLAQAFTPSSTGRLDRVDVNLKNATAAAGSVMVKVFSDSAGSPGSELSSTSIASTAIGTSYAYLSAIFNKPASVVSGTQYWLVCYVQAPVTNSYAWSSTTAASTAKTSINNGVTWSGASFALNFKTYIATDSPVLGLYRAYKSNGSKTSLMAHGTSLYSINEVDGSLTAIKTGLNAGATKYRFSKANDVTYYVNGVDAPRKWDFTTEAATGGSPEVASNIIEHKGYMFYMSAADPTKYFWTNFGVYETFTSTDFAYVPSPKSSDPLTGWDKLNDTLVMFTLHNKFMLFGTNNSTWQLVQAPGRKGTFTQETVCSDTNYLYFLAEDGVYRFNGTQDEMISLPIYQDIINITNKQNCVLAVNNGRLYLYYADANSGFNNRCFVYNINLDKWESKDTETYVSRAVTMINDNNMLLVGSSIVGQASYQELPSNDYSNMGAPINFELRTAYYNFGAPAQDKEIRTWRPRFTTQSAAYTADCYFAANKTDAANLAPNGSVSVQGTGALWGSGAKWGSFIWGKSAFVESSLYVPGQYQYTQLRYKHTGARQPVEFLGHTLVVELRRIR